MMVPQCALPVRYLFAPLPHFGHENEQNASKAVTNYRSGKLAGTTKRAMACYLGIYFQTVCTYALICLVKKLLWGGYGSTLDGVGGRPGNAIQGAKSMSPSVP